MWRLNWPHREQARSYIWNAFPCRSEPARDRASRFKEDFEWTKKDPVQRKSHRVFCCQRAVDVVDPPPAVELVV
ncbi:hypothetical protein EMIT0215P_60033 [Pseudomonas serboccidentalis]